jgi:phage tail-like protein
VPTIAKPPSTRHHKNGATPDPVGELRFQVRLGSLNIGRFRECGGIAVEVETKDYMEGGVNDFVHKLPTRIKYPNVVLKRGVTHEAALLDWFYATRNDYPGQWQELTIQLNGPGGDKIRAWAFTNAYPVKWTGPTLNAGSNQIAVETLEMVHNGFKAA